MKRTILTLTGIVLAFFTMANGQFERALGKNIPLIFSSQSSEELQGVINQLERISAAETDRWESHYYTAFGYLQMSGMYKEATDKDKFLSLAMDAVKKGQKIDADNSELVALEGYVIMMQLVIDPGTRGMTHAGAATETFYKAIQLDGKNPRAHYLLGRMKYGTSQFMGGGTEDACKSLNVAKELFESLEPSTNPILPSWGKGATDEALAQICK